MPRSLTIIITHYNTADFVENLLHALSRLTASSYKVLVSDNGSKNSQLVALRKIAAQHENVWVRFREGESDASEAHGSAMDELISEVDTPYFAVFDSDTCVFSKGWDLDLINQLDNKIKVVGSPLPETSRGRKPADFPFQFIVLFETKTFRDLGISWKPDLSDKSRRDTGWELRPRYLDAGYAAKLLEAKNTRTYKEGPFKDVICVEYYWQNRLFGSHFSRGSQGGIGKHLAQQKKRYAPVFRMLYPFFRLRSSLLARKEKKLWLATCADLVENSSGENHFKG